jgi:hypothetical protein
MRDYGPRRGIIEDNDITDGDQFGIEIKDGADPCVGATRSKRMNGVWHLDT